MSKKVTHYVESSVLPLSDFYRQVNEYINSIRAITVPSVSVNIPWSSGEFNMLRDQGFLDSVERLPDGYSISLIGNVEERPHRLGILLKTLARMAEQEETAEDRLITSKKQNQIKQLFKKRKLYFYMANYRLEEPHMAAFPEYIYIQQRHEHNIPAAIVLIKNPSENLKRFVHAYMEELKNSNIVSPVLFEEQ